MAIERNEAVEHRSAFHHPMAMLQRQALCIVLPVHCSPETHRNLMNRSKCIEIGAFSAWCMSIYDSVDETKRRNYIISIIPQPLINFLYNECCQQDRSVHADGKRSRATIVRLKREKREWTAGHFAGHR